MLGNAKKIQKNYFLYRNIQKHVKISLKNALAFSISMISKIILHK